MYASKKFNLRNFISNVCFISYYRMMTYFTYILLSESSGRFYIGQTNNLSERLKRHNGNQSKSTKNRGPWKLYFHTEFETRSEAVILEQYLKSLKNHQLIDHWMAKQSG